LHLTETKVSMPRLLSKHPEFKSRMLDLGYVYCAAVWTTDGFYGDHYAGSMVFSKFSPREETFGVGNKSLDEKGRAVSINWSVGNWSLYTYTPCLRPGDHRCDRMEYDRSWLPDTRSYLLCGEKEAESLVT
jgi:hypothetical protein